MERERQGKITQIRVWIFLDAPVQADSLTVMSSPDQMITNAKVTSKVVTHKPAESTSDEQPVAGGPVTESSTSLIVGSSGYVWPSTKEAHSIDIPDGNQVLLSTF